MVRVAVIGAGVSGLTATKACLEAGFSVDCFEKTDDFGGLWRYRDEDLDGVGSVFWSTTTNTSKEMMAFSDFPPPEHFPNYYHNTQVIEYLENYMKTFAIDKKVNYNTEVISLRPTDDHLITGRWNLTVRNLVTNEVKTDDYDGVMVCSGQHWLPNEVTFRDQDSFEGQIIHAKSYKKPDPYNGKTVVVVGVGNSGADLAVELSEVAKKVYLSTRRGSWIVPLTSFGGAPFDALMLRRFIQQFIFKLVPKFIINSFAETYQTITGISHPKLKPKHRLFNQQITANDHLSSKIQAGTVTVAKDINRFTPNGVIFEGDDHSTPCDVVILATGYRIKFPFLDLHPITSDDGQMQLFKRIFPIDLPHPKTLAFIGLVKPNGPFFPVAEMQARLFVELMAGRKSLPDVLTMRKDIERAGKSDQRFYDSKRNQRLVYWIDYLDELAELLGVKPNLAKMMFKDPKLCAKLVFGPSVPYQYRLKGPNQWLEARQAILEAWDRIKDTGKTKKKIMKKG